MVREKWHFLEFSFPTADMFYADEDCEQPLFIGQLEIVKNKIQIKVLSSLGNSHGYGGTLYARLRPEHSPNELVSWSFFNCHYSGHLSQKSVDFESCIKHSNGNNKGWKNWRPDKSERTETPVPKFIKSEDKFKKVSLEIDGLDNWLWKLKSDEEIDTKSKFRPDFRDKTGKSYFGYNKSSKNKVGFDKSLVEMAVPLHTIHKRIRIDENTTVEIHSVPSEYGEYPNFEIGQHCHIDIISKEPRLARFFYWVIYNLQLYFSLITDNKCKVHRISYHEVPIYNKTVKVKPYKNLEFFDNRLGWDIEKKKYGNWFVGYHMTYRHIKSDLGKSLKLFFEKHRNIHNIVSFVLDMNNMREKEYTEVYFTNQMQIIETYGNIKSKGKNNTTRQDINTTMSLLPDKVFEKLFIHYYETKNFVPGHDIFGFGNSDKSVSELQSILKIHLPGLRNFITHPCKNGKYKDPKTEKLFDWWYDDNGFLRLEAVSALSTSINKMLRWFVLQEVGLEKYFEI